MNDYRTYISSKQRKQRQLNQEDLYFDEIQDGCYEDSLLDKRVFNQNLEHDVQQKRILTTFIQTYDQYTNQIIIEKNFEEDYSESQNSYDMNSELEMEIIDNTQLDNPCLDGFRILEVNEVNYLEENSNPKQIRYVAKKKKNLSKKIFKVKH